MSRRIEVEVFEIDGTDPLISHGTLSSDSARQFFDDLNDVGAWSLEVKADHADEAKMADGRLVRFSIDDTPVGWGLIESKRKVAADPDNREAGRVVNVSGRGALALLEEGIVYPELGLGRISPETRYMNFASTLYDDSAWGSAVELKQQSDPADPWGGAPRDWPDPDAFWVGPTDGDVPPVTPGDIYLRGSFTIPSGEGGDYRFYLTADDGFELYVDANKVAAEQVAGLWGLTRYIDLLLDEGSHLVAVKAINFDRPVAATNVFGFILTVVKLLGGGSAYGDVVSRSSAGTKMLDYPSTAPGLTPSTIFYSLAGEAAAAGAVVHVSYWMELGAVGDGTGDDVAFTNEIDLAFPVGTTLLDVTRRMVEEKACDVSVNPSTLLAGWGDEYLSVRLWTSKGLDRSSTVELVYAENIGALEFDHTPPGPNTLLTRTAEGRYAQFSDETAATSWRRRQAFLQLGAAPSDGAADRQASAFLADHAEPADVISRIRIEVVDGGPVPFVDFNTGDVVTAPDYDGNPAPFLVTGIHVTEDEAGNPFYDLDLEAA